MVSEKVMHDFLNILPAVLYEYVLYPDGSSELLYMSPSAKEILGYDAEYFVEDVQRFWQKVHPDDVKRLQEEDRIANQQNCFFVCEVRFQHACGEKIWMQLSSKPSTEMKNNAVIWSGYMIVITRIKKIELALLEANQRLKSLSQTDGLTGLANRQHFDETLDSEWARFERTARPFSLLFIDIDYFKEFNDQYGHLMGDNCLKKIASILQDFTRRAGDIAARYGGEEFVIIAFDSKIADAVLMAEDIRESVASLNMVHECSRFNKLTVSIGVAAIEDNEYPDQTSLLKAADMALYQAKRAKRNCVRSANNLQK